MPLYFKCLTGNFKARKLIRPMGCNHRDLGTGIQRSISMHTTVRRRCEWVKRERESVFNNCNFVPEKEKWIGDRERGLTLKVKTEERERERERERDSLLKMIQRTRERPGGQMFSSHLKLLGQCRWFYGVVVRMSWIAEFSWKLSSSSAVHPIVNCSLYSKVRLNKAMLRLTPYRRRFGPTYLKPL